MSELEPINFDAHKRGKPSSFRIDYAPALSARFETDGVWRTDSSSERQKALANILPDMVSNDVSGFSIKKQYHSGVDVVIPIHTDERIETLQHTLESLHEQKETYPHGLNVVIVDNGLTENGVRDVLARGEALELPLTRVDAKPTNKNEKNAAHARNRAVAQLRELGRDNPELRRGGIVFIDSDTALLQGAITALENTLRQNDAVAATAKNISVYSIDKQARIRLEDQKGKGKDRKLPKPINDNGEIDPLKIIAFGSDVNIKTCGVYVDRDGIERFEKPFLIYPNGSGEDMLFSAALSRQGEIFHTPSAVVLDLARESDDQVREQRRKWGQDHVVIYNDLVEQERVPSGLHVIEPDGNHWREWKVPGTDRITGLVINPKQIEETGRQLRQVINHEGVSSFGKDINGEDLEEGLEIIRQVLSIITVTRPEFASGIRKDIPRPIKPKIGETRYSENALVGLLAGNILGMSEIQQINHGILPNRILLGLRQSAKWE